MPGGALRESVTFQRRAAGDDGRGNVTTGAWTDLAGAIAQAAQIKPVRQGEVALAEGVQGRVLFEVTVRNTAALVGIRVGDRMLNARSGASFNVKSPPTNPDMHNRYLKILVEAGGADG